MSEVNKRLPALTDSDPMPFGKYKNKPMKDVPATYLAWLWNNGCDNELVSNYIYNNITAINMDLPPDKEILRK